MANTKRTPTDEPQQSRDNPNGDLEREDVTPSPRRGDEEAVRGQNDQRGPTDPDSAESDVDRDDMIGD